MAKAVFRQQLFKQVMPAQESAHASMFRGMLHTVRRGMSSAALAAPAIVALIALSYPAGVSEQHGTLSLADATCVPGPTGEYAGPTGGSENSATGISSPNYIPPCSESPALNPYPRAPSSSGPINSANISTGNNQANPMRPNHDGKYLDMGIEGGLIVAPIIAYLVIVRRKPYED